VALFILKLTNAGYLRISNRMAKSEEFITINNMENISDEYLKCMLIQYIKDNFMNFGIKTNEQILKDFYETV
jgi:hypothetical protein